MKTENNAVDINRNIGDFAYPEVHVRDAGRGLSEKTIHYISDVKEDPDWVREFRLRGLKTFLEKPLPTHWASKDLEAIDFDKIRYYRAPRDSRTGTKISRWCRSAVRQRSCLFKHQKGGRRTRRHFRRINRGPQESSRDFPEMVQQGHPDWRQQIQCAEFRCVQRR